MSLAFNTIGTVVILTYSPDGPYASQLHSELSYLTTPKDITIKQIYNLSTLDYLSEKRCTELLANESLEHIIPIDEFYSDESISFQIANLSDGYYKFRPSIFNGPEVNISVDVELNDKFFRASRNISIMKRLFDFGINPIYIGGKFEDAIDLRTYKLLLKNFPTSTELSYYSEKRIGEVIQDFLPSPVNWEEKYVKYMERKISYITVHDDPIIHDLDIVGTFRLEKQKLIRLYDTLNRMLSSSLRFKEKQWQKLISMLLLLLFPKYIKLIEEFQIKNPQKSRSYLRSDFVVVDYDGFIDLVEIKTPETLCMSSKRKYRENYFPTKELSATVIQMENYIYALTYWGKTGEEAINEKYKNELPSGVLLRTVSPRGLLIMGRNIDFNTDQLKLDFELIKRQYKNIIDILTYDDLLRRLDTLIQSI